MLRGFDISAYEGSEAPTGGDFVFVKATEGSSYTNGKFAAQWASAGARAAVRGAYHFARPEESSGASQADRLLARARAVPGELLVLDLEASKLNQSQTNAWAREFGDRLRTKAPGVTTVVYMGSGYASNGTGKDLADHFSLWWYPQYPSTAKTTTWRTTFDPWLPSGLTCGWSKPHIWQWTDNFGGLDASLSPLTITQLTGSTPAPPPKPPTPTPKPWPGTYYRVTSPMMHGSNVTWIQQRLTAHGHKTTADGEYGPHTRASVEAFQKDDHLQVDGVVGAKTWAALAK
jgi:hypothetical protein